MKIFIKNIPENTTPDDLVRFFTPFLKKSLKHPFRTKGKLTKQYVVAQIDQEDNIVGRHGLVTIEPDEVAKSILKRMRRIPFKGKKVIVRKFIDRSWQNDHTSHQSQPKISSINQHRRFDLRQHTLKVVTGFQITFSDQVQIMENYG